MDIRSTGNYPRYGGNFSYSWSPPNDLSIVLTQTSLYINSEPKQNITYNTGTFGVEIYLHAYHLGGGSTLFGDSVADSIYAFSIYNIVLSDSQAAALITAMQAL